MKRRALYCLVLSLFSFGNILAAEDTRSTENLRSTDPVDCQQQLTIEPLLRRRSRQLREEQAEWLSGVAAELADECRRGNKHAADIAQQRVYHEVGGAEIPGEDQNIRQLLNLSAAEISRAELGGEISRALRSISKLRGRVRPLPQWLHRASDSRVYSFMARMASYVPRLNVFYRYHSVGRLLGKVQTKLEKGLAENREDRQKIEKLADQIGNAVSAAWERAALLMALEETISASGNVENVADHRLRRSLYRDALDLAELAFVLDNTRFGLEAVEDFYEDLERAGTRALRLALPALQIVASEMTFAARGLIQARDMIAIKSAVGRAVVLSNQMVERLAEVVGELNATPLVSQDQLQQALRARSGLRFSRLGPAAPTLESNRAALEESP